VKIIITLNVIVLYKLLYIDYCRPIIIDQAMNFYLYDQDLIIILGRTFSQQFIFNFESCLICGASYDDSFVIMKCHCKICNKCCLDKIKQATDGRIICNKFEKSNNKLFIIRILC
jgi:hypothetical protein